MNIVIAPLLGPGLVKKTSFIPRVGDKIDNDISFLEVTGVILWPSTSRLKPFTSADDIEAIVYVL